MTNGDKRMSSSRPQRNYTRRSILLLATVAAALITIALPSESRTQTDFGSDTALEVSAPTEQPAAVPEPEPEPEGVFERNADYSLRLQELEDRVNDLKEQIFRSKSRLVLLREQVLRTSLGGSQALLAHVNNMSSTFDLEQVIYSLDGNQIYSVTDDDGNLADRDTIEIYNGAILPGAHNIAVEMSFVGNGYGLFSYLEGYRFRLRSSYAFTAEDGKIAHVNIVAYEQGGINQPIEERPDIRYELDFTDSILVEE